MLTEETRLFVPLPMSYNSDKLEQADLAGIMNWPSEWPDINSLVTTAALGDPAVSAPPRTQAGMAQVMRWCLEYNLLRGLPSLRQLLDRLNS